MKRPSRDVFLCHTSADKKQFVEPFIAELEKRGITYWYDKAEVKWGDSVTNTIEKGLRISRFVIVFLSEKFIGRKWPEAELSSALSREFQKRKIRVLPLILGDKDKILEKYQLLWGKHYIEWKSGIPTIVDELSLRLRDKHCSNDSRPGKGQNKSFSKLTPALKRQLLDELFGLGAILRDLQGNKDKLSFASQMINGLVRILMKGYGMQIHDDATDIDIFLREVETDSQKAGILERDLYCTGVSLDKLQDTVESIRRLISKKTVRPEFGEDIWRNLTYLFGIIFRLLSPNEASDVSIAMEMISSGESQTVEFKSSLRWDMKENRINKDLRKAVAKEVAAFMNSSGGTVFIGVDNAGEILGLEKDIDIIPGKDLDSLARVFHDTISELCGKECYEYISNVNFIEIYDKTVLVVKVEKGKTPIFYVDRDNVQLLVRIGSTTKSLNVKEAIEHYKLRWQNTRTLS